MGPFILRRLGAAAIVLFLGSVLVFLGVRALPGDPARALAGEEAGPEALAAIRHEYGLDQPLPVQYAHYVGHALTRRPRPLHPDRPPGRPHPGASGCRSPSSCRCSRCSSPSGSASRAGVVAATRRGKLAD